jgi:hypothetical protein
LVDRVSDGNSLIRNELNDVLTSQSKCQERLDALRGDIDKEIGALKSTSIENPIDHIALTNQIEQLKKEL